MSSILECTFGVISPNTKPIYLDDIESKKFSPEEQLLMNELGNKLLPTEVEYLMKIGCDNVLDPYCDVGSIERAILHIRDSYYVQPSERYKRRHHNRLMQVNIADSSFKVDIFMSFEGRLIYKMYVSIDS